MNKRETIQVIQKKLEGIKGFPVMDYLNKLTEQNLFSLMMAIVFSQEHSKTKSGENK